MKMFLMILMIDLYFIFKASLSFTLLQKEKFKNKGYLKRVYKDINTNIVPFMLTILLIVMLFLANPFTTYHYLTSFFSLIFMLILLTVEYVKEEEKYNEKRMIPLKLIYYIIFIITEFYLSRFVLNKYVAFILLYSLISPFIIIIINSLTSLFIKKDVTMQKAILKIKELTDYKVFALPDERSIYYLNNVLKKSYKTFVSSSNLKEDILLSLKSDANVLIVNSNDSSIADFKNEISLSALVAKNKDSLLNESLLAKGGKIIINKDIDEIKKFKSAFKNKVMGISIDSNSTLKAKNIGISKNGTKFDVNLNKSNVTIKTTLLGRDNIETILYIIAIMLDLGYDNSQIVEEIKNLSPLKNDLELTNNDKHTIIKDSSLDNEQKYNEALELLDKMAGKKILISKRTDFLNDEINKICDYIYYVGPEEKYATCKGAYLAINRLYKDKRVSILIEDDKKEV